MQYFNRLRQLYLRSTWKDKFQQRSLLPWILLSEREGKMHTSIALNHVPVHPTPPIESPSSAGNMFSIFLDLSMINITLKPCS